jgi:hypothetical protein
LAPNESVLLHKFRAETFDERAAFTVFSIVVTVVFVLVVDWLRLRGDQSLSLSRCLPIILSVRTNESG